MDKENGKDRCGYIEFIHKDWLGDALIQLPSQL